MKAKKKYAVGGQMKGGPVKTKKKKMSPEEREAETTKMAGVAKERLAEMEAEKAYLKRRSEADREYKQAIKEGATPEQATKIAEKYLKNGGKMSMYEKGGKIVGPKKKDKVVELSDSYIKQQEGFAKSAYNAHLDALKKTGKRIYATDKARAEIAAVKNMYTDLDYSSLTAKDREFVEKHKKQASLFSSSSVSSPVKLKKK